MASLDDRLDEMLEHIERSRKCLESLKGRPKSSDRLDTSLDTAMQQIESSCIHMRRLCEEIRPPHPPAEPGTATYARTLSGSAERMENGWLHIQLDTLLPHYRRLGSTAYITDTITRLLDRFTAEGGKLPFYHKAHLVILEECNFNVCEAFDQDNKGFKGVLNALKGRVFADDNQFELSLGLFTELSANVYCHIYVLPDEEAGDFHYIRQHTGIW